MKIVKRQLMFAGLCFIASVVFLTTANAQGANGYEVLSDDDSSKIVPTSFYFAGQSAPTQMRNAAVAKIGKDRFVLAGMVDTSGYSTEISGKYEGFFITDSPVRLGNKRLATGAYGFGFAKGGKIKIFDLSSKEILWARTFNDENLKRPRPLMLTATKRGIRLYKGKSFVLITR